MTYLSSLFLDLEADGACWGTTRTGFLISYEEWDDVLGCDKMRLHGSLCFLHPQWIAHCSAVNAWIYIHLGLLQMNRFKNNSEMWLHFYPLQWSYLFLIFFVCILVQDLPLLAAPCRWDHLLCTDLKQAGKMMANAVRRTRSYKYIIWLYVSYCIYPCVDSSQYSSSLEICKQIGWFEVSGLQMNKT